MSFREFFTEKTGGRRPRVKFKGQRVDDFKDVQNLRPFMKSVNSIWPGRKFDLETIIEMYSYHQISLSERTVIKAKPATIYPYREFDRSERSNRSDDEVARLKKDIQANGIKEAVTIHMSRNKQTGDTEAWLDEGNHRLLIAMDLKLRTVPTRFTYSDV